MALELILQQRYRVDGIPVDLSPYRNHGSGVDTASAPGPAVSQFAVSFPNNDSQVAIQPTAAQGWASLLAIKVEMVVFVDAVFVREQGLIDASGAFTFAISEKALTAQIAGPGGAFVRAADAFAPDGQFHPVPLERWVTVGFYHDGFSKIQLTMDGKLVGQADVSSGVPPLQGSIAVGNHIGGSHPLNGRIDEVRVWRSDPKAMQREFLCRPYTPKTAACWQALFEDVVAWAKAEPAAVASLLQLAEQGRRALLGGLELLSPADQAEARGLLNRFMKLWCEGKIDGDAMRKVIRQWLELLKKHGLDTDRGQRMAELQRVLNAAKTEAPVIDPKCDPAMQAFFALIGKEEAALGP
ncbi:LamG-like jellyroll fold domain-containing protein [Tunturiibacter empetritectus]|uniref:Concanavalin A-like lectin/glucanase superfamily protein n=2 Tax=Tunturiibacter TaxID=3154218 RepID=A0A852VG56_9BACT|nr:LamG-like jellyroll fold domain-containing protein [Edaphobacter lichenicola]NYF91803.1 hypothetical protein [Edaphobacter lichenicola]